ncbi:MAG TPA: FAD:protein FMN transferase, partial [Terriglobia bacterium]|nr:FAD:protein FMN transferase [Terriglobia bacterium]
GDPPPGKAGWRIAVQPLDPEPGTGDSRIQDSKSAIQNRYLVLHDAGVSTSGDAEQHVELGGVRYSHIVDPKTGRALTGHQSVTVVARDDFAADGLATAVSVLGPERGLKLIEGTHGAGVLFVKQTKDGIRSWQLRFLASVGAEAPTP